MWHHSSSCSKILRSVPSARIGVRFADKALLVPTKDYYFCSCPCKGLEMSTSELHLPASDFRNLVSFFFLAYSTYERPRRKKVNVRRSTCFELFGRNCVNHFIRGPPLRYALGRKAWLTQKSTVLPENVKDKTKLLVVRAKKQNPACLGKQETRS